VLLAQRTKPGPADDPHVAKGAGAFFVVNTSLEISAFLALGAMIGLDVVFHRWERFLVGAGLGSGVRFSQWARVDGRAESPVLVVPTQFTVDFGIRIGESLSSIVFRAGFVVAWLSALRYSDFVRSKALGGLQFRIQDTAGRGYWVVEADLFVVDGAVFVLNLGRSF
jgi:hypothetical protein